MAATAASTTGAAAWASLTVKDAADRGYRVVCLSDACQAETPERHQQALACFQGYAALITVEQFAAALQAAAPRP